MGWLLSYEVISTNQKNNQISKRIKISFQSKDPSTHTLNYSCYLTVSSKKNHEIEQCQPSPAQPFILNLELCPCRDHRIRLETFVCYKLAVK